MPARSRAVFALVLVTLLLVAGAATVAASPLSDPGPSGSVAVASQFEPNTTYHIDMQPNGDARWTITFTFSFEDDADRAGFETIAERFERDDYSALTTAPFERATVLASNATGRPMRITDVNRTTRTASDTGSLVLSFTWTNFGYREADQLRVDDVFDAPEEPWFSRLDENEQLIVSLPPGYQFVSASTNIQNRTLRWDGPHSFVGDAPFVAYDEVESPPVTTSPTPIPTTPTTSPTPTTPTAPTSQSGNLWLLAVVGIALVGAIAAVAYVATRRDEPLFPVDSGSEATETDASAGATDGSADAADTESDDRDETTAADDSPPTDDAGESADTGSAVPIDEELLSDEERVERLLEQNGGRMKQANIVTETDWSNAKVSQLLSAMAEEGRIEKLRIGRENLISFPDEDITDLDEE